MRITPFFALLVASALGDVQLGTPYTVGNAGFGYKLAIPDGDSGYVILASNPVGEFQTIITRTLIGEEGTPNGPGSGQVALLNSKGHVNAGCLHIEGSKTFLYAALSASGFVARVDLSFPDKAVEYLNATDSSRLWAGASPQQFVSIVCQDRYIYFGTESASVSNTIARLDTQDTNPATRFAVLGPIAPGDFTRAIPWGTDALFVMEADGDTPTTFYVVNGGSGFALKAATPLEGVTGFNTISGLSGDFTSRTLTIANGNGLPEIATVDLSLVSHATITHRLALQTEGLSPITSFTPDLEANVAYASVGDCETDAGTALVAIRLTNPLTQADFVPTPASTLNCTEKGTPALAFLVKAVNDTRVSPAPRRHLVVATQRERSAGEGILPGALIPYTVYGAGPCPADCNSPNGICSAEVCHCSVAFTGATCSDPAPCGGTDCSSHGTCHEDGSCECHVGYAGGDCSELVPCPLSCSGHGACEASVCQCSEGYAGLACELETTGCQSLNNCHGHGTCVHAFPFGSCDCDAGFTGNDCSTIDLSCPSNCTGHGQCSQGECTCDVEWTGLDCSVLVPTCPNNCSARGNCDLGHCSCFPGFQGEDCGSVDTSSCLHGCSGHGSCVRGICECANGFSGVDCAHVDNTLQPSSEVILVAGENKATSSFVVSVTANEVVFCVASVPGKCIAFDPVTMARVRDASFEDQTTAVLLQSAEGVEKLKGALVPESLSLLQLQSHASSQLRASVGQAPISVAVVEDTPDGFAILGTKANDGTMHGQLIKISTSTLTRLAELEFDDDTGSGVTAGIRGSDGSFFFASGNSPAMIYKVNAQLEIVSRVSAEQAPNAEVTTLLYDGSKHLIATAGNSVHVYEVKESSIEPPVNSSVTVLPDAFGTVGAGFVDVQGQNTVAYLGTSSAPAAIVKLTISPTSTTSESIRLRSGENRASSVIRQGDTSYWGLGSESNACSVAKVSVSAFREEESVALENCSGDLVSASISTDGDFVYFGNNASPAHVYSVRLFTRSSCPSNCTGHGFCVQGTCSCDVGFGGDDCRIPDPICPNNCSQAGICRNSTCHCQPGHFGADCSVIEICVDKCQNGRCAGPESGWPCVCESEAWAGTYCSQRTNYCPRECSNHGSCDHGICRCSPGYHGEDCSRETFPPVSQRGCAADADCGSHGVCDLNSGTGTGSCVCAAGWSGEDCDIDEAFRDALETNKITTTMLVLLGAFALVVGLVGGVSVYKSFAGASQGAPTNATARASAVPAGSKVPSSTGYTRFPHPSHRLVK